MQDQILGRMWTDQHEEFSADLTSALSKASAKLRGLFGGVPMPLRAMAAVLAMSVTSLIFSAPAMAQSEIQVRPASVAVSYADLDIRTAAGLAALNGRVRGAASQLCQPNLAGVTRERIERRNCFDTAVESVRPQLEQALAARSQDRFAAARTITITAR